MSERPRRDAARGVGGPASDAARPPRVRLFVALDLPDPARAALGRFRDAAADPLVWRPLDAASFHVTLAFLGHRPADDVERVAGVLGDLPPWDPPPLELSGGLLLPPRRARVLTVALADPGGGLAVLQAAVSAGLAAAGLHQPEARPFRAHVTVARLRSGARAPRELDVEPEPLAFTAGAVTLYRSRLGRGGAVYENLYSRGA
jgi:RNA 2',3'-cyclic 3'-phosphodiesterase